MLLADRFINNEGAWFDAATTERVVVVVREVGRGREQAEWEERMAALTALRHPLFLPLVDYGCLGARGWFEAFAALPPLKGSAAALSHVVTHGTRFLAAHGIPLSPAMAATMVRTIAVDEREALQGRPVGIRLQQRAALTAIGDLLQGHLPRGSPPLRIAGTPGMGLRTLRLMAAKLARHEGYIPVCAEALWRWPGLGDALGGRHVCLLLGAESGASQRAAAARLLARLSAGTAATPVCLITDRGHGPREGTIHLEPMGMRAMTRMIHVNPDYGPSEHEIAQAARWAGGAPGLLLERLNAMAFGERSSLADLVRESPAPYLIDAKARSGSDVAARERQGHDDRADDLARSGRGLADIAAARPSRIGSALWRACSRAAALEARGRHAAAGRLLTRAARVLQGRGERALAAECWLQLGWMARTRGALERAREHARQASGADDSTGCQLRAALLAAVCTTDEGGFEEGRGTAAQLVTAAETIADRELADQCRLALARALLWAGRTAEATATIRGIDGRSAREVDCAAAGMLARCRLASGDLPGALAAARLAIGSLPVPARGRLAASVHRTMAEALAEAGDLAQVRVHVQAGLEAAVTARLPLQALRLRAVLVRALRQCGGPAAETRRLALALSKACRRALPVVVRTFIAQQLDGTPRSPSGVRAPRASPFEEFLDRAHRAPGDLEALTSVLSALCERLSSIAAVIVAADGRVCASAGKAWPAESRVVREALLGGRRVLFDRAHQPPEAAEPILCAGTLLAVVSARWVAGSHADPIEISEVLRAAGLSLASHLRSVLEEPPKAPASVWGDLLGDSDLAGSLREDILRAARAPFPVLIEGESGSGKELVARAVHRLSSRHARRFCAINCAALSDELVEAELFGHARGAFTGAMTERAGLFEEADGGTLFLDEVGELSARAQAKLLRVLQEGEVRRVGENLPRRVDVRIVAATNRRLEGEAASGRFRADLRFRLDVLRIVVPPLRERAGDIAVLAQHFWKQAAERVGSQATLGSEAVAALSRYDWPGNVRELQNAIAWMAVHAPRRGRVGTARLPAQLAGSMPATGSSFEAAREEFERRYVRAALAQAGGHRVLAARAMGVSRQGLAKMMRRLGIE